MEWGGPLEMKNKQFEEKRKRNMAPVKDKMNINDEQNNNMLILAKDYDRENQKN